MRRQGERGRQKGGRDEKIWRVICSSDNADDLQNFTLVKIEKKRQYKFPIVECLDRDLKDIIINRVCHLFKWNISLNDVNSPFNIYSLLFTYKVPLISAVYCLHICIVLYPTLTLNNMSQNPRCLKQKNSSFVLSKYFHTLFLLSDTFEYVQTADCRFTEIVRSTVH